MKLRTRLLTGGLCSALALALFPFVAAAQTAGQQCSEMEMLQHRCGDQQRNKSKDSKNSKQEDKYPNATRKEPRNRGVSSREVKPLNEGLAAANSGDVATAEKLLQPIAEDGSSNYAKAMASLGLAQAKFQAGDTKGAIAMQKQALESDGLDNNSYFQGLISLAQMYIADEDYSNALATLDKWTKESGAQSANVEALKGNAYYRLQKYPEAVAAVQKAKSLTTTPEPSWDQILMASYFAMDKYDEAAKLAESALAKDPNNAALIKNAVAIYVNAHQYQKALALLERARASGQMKDETDYVNMAKMYDNVAQSSDDPKAGAMKAVAVIQEGISKGIIQPGFDTYKLLGDSYGIAGDYENAAAAYGKASADAKDGSVDFLRGQMLENLGKHKEAKAALELAIKRGGFKRIGAAYLTLGNAELNMQHKSAAIAAYKQALQDPETKSDAQRMLKQLGQG